MEILHLLCFFCWIYAAFLSEMQDLTARDRQNFFGLGAGAVRRFSACTSEASVV